MQALTTSKHRFQVHPAQVRINIEQSTHADGEEGGVSPYSRRMSGLGGRSPISPISPRSPLPSYHSPQSPTARDNFGFSAARGWGRGRIEDEIEIEEEDAKYVITEEGEEEGKSEKSLGDTDETKVSPIDVDEEASCASPASSYANEQRVVLANLARIPPVPSPVPVHVRSESGIREEERERGRGREREGEEVGGVRIERVGYGF